MDSDQDDDFAARDNNSQQDNVSQDMFDDEDLSNHNAAAIDSIVERMEADPPNLDVDDLQDDVDLGLDVIETASNDDGSRPSSPLSVINNEHSSEINYAESHRPESPQDIEFQDEKPESAEFAAATADIYSRRVELRLERLRIGSNCYVKGSRVDLYKLKEASPGLFKNVKLGVKSDKNKEKKSKKDDKKEKERKKSSDKKEKKEKKPKPATSTKIVSLALISSDSDSDSDLEEMKKRLMKPGVISSSTSKQKFTVLQFTFSTYSVFNSNLRIILYFSRLQTINDKCCFEKTFVIRGSKKTCQIGKKAFKTSSKRFFKFFR